MIKKYPNILNTDYTCPACGCVFSLTKRDIKRNSINVEDGLINTNCPCCNTEIPLVSAISIIDELFNEIEGVLRGIAEEIKQEDDSQIRFEKAALLDEIYNEIIEIRGSQKWRG